MGHPYISPLGKAVAYELPAGGPTEVDVRNATATGVTQDDIATSDRRVYLALRSAADVQIYFSDPATSGAPFATHPAGDWFELPYNGQVWVVGAAPVQVVEAY